VAGVDASKAHASMAQGMKQLVHRCAVRCGSHLTDLSLTLVR